VIGLVLRYFRIYGLLVALAFLTHSCAQQVAPTGGEKDTTPPRILRSTPQSESVNMQDDKIALEFDEYVALKNATQELIVSPPLKYPVQFKMKNKKLSVIWKDTLAENSTYLFQFGEGIVDVNEGNPLDSNVFVFSTGPYIDSFEISGIVIDAFDLKPAKDIWVMLYTENVDSLPLTELPRYFAKTDERGAFHLQYLAMGNYKLFCLETMNGGYLYDVPGEAIAFLDGMIPSTTSGDTLTQDSSYTLQLFVEEDSTQFVKEFKQLTNKGLMFQFNRTVSEITITELTNNENVPEWTENWSAAHDSVVYWFAKPSDYDSLRVEVKADDFIDTVFFRKPVERKGKAKRSGAKVDDGSFKLKMRNKGVLDFYKALSIDSKTPIKEVNSVEQFVFVEGEDTIDVTPYLKREFYNIRIEYPWKEGMKYKLLIPDSLVFSQFGETQDTLLFAFTTSRKEDYGQLKMKRQLPDLGHGYIWQLMGAEDKLIDEQFVSAIGELDYDYLPTGEYRVRIFFDVNDNEIWDTGYYKGKRQPERTTYYDQKIEIRSNWATEVEWILVD
jgi:hypothetical protein